MRKAFVILIAVVLLLGISGCKSVPAAQEEPSLIDAVNACNIALALNAHNIVDFNGVHKDNITLEDAKILVGEFFWPAGLSHGEERAAWELIVIKDGWARLVPEAHEALQIAAKYAYCIATAVNVHKALYPSWPYGPVSYYDMTLEYVKENINDGYWPEGLSDEEERAACELIVYKDFVAALAPAAWEALQGETRYESDRVKIANAKVIAVDINFYNEMNPKNMLPDNMTLAEVKEALGEYLWPSFLTDAEAGEAWELIEISDGEAKVKDSD